MTNARNPATPAAKIQTLPYSPTAIRAALINLKGAEKGPATFEAVAPVFSALVASGGSKAELQATTATALVFRELHAETLKTSTARAFRQCSALALADFAKSGRAGGQDDHDARMLALSAAWCAHFKDAAPKAKSEGETSAQKIARLTAENAALRIECDALGEALAKAKATTVAA